MTTFNRKQLSLLVLLRVLIGWHFLYEGVVKWMNPDWSSRGYLLDSKGFLTDFFGSIASSPSLLKTIDTLNVYGLIAIGISLMVGFLSRPALIAGASLLFFYFLSHPPMIGYSYAIPSEGSYLWINKNLIEAIAMLVLFVFPTSRIIGIDRLIFGEKTK